MFVKCLACVLSLALAGGVAFAQSNERGPRTSRSAPSQKSDPDAQAIQERIAYWLKTCLEDWDQATHMTKSEWRTTCQRVAAERGKFMTEDAITRVRAKGR